MQNISISLVTSSTADVSSVKTTKANDNTFENFMLNHGSKVKQANAVKNDEQIVSPVKTNDRDVVSQDFKSNKEVVKSDKSDLQPGDKVQSDKEEMSDGQDVMQELTEEQIEEISAEVIATIQQVLQIPQELIQDILNQMNVDFEEFATALIEQDVPQLMNEFAKEFVMDLHGITDQAAFITNGDLNLEMSQLVEQLEQFELSEMPTEATPIVMATEEVVEVLEDKIEVENIVREDVVNVSASKVQVEVEQDGASSDFSDEGTKSDVMTTTDLERETVPNELLQNHTQVFAENLTKAFEHIAQPIEADSTLYNVTPQQLVDQVIERVKVRVMPETTNLELQLHPESLGRVNVQVNAATQGMTTAVLTVENEFAKEALESQLVVLKQHFEEQGLKVDSVEVTVSNFGLNDEQRDAQNEQQQNGGQGSRRYHGNSGMDDEETSGQETETSRRDVNSTVDYTA